MVYLSFKKILIDNVTTLYYVLKQFSLFIQRTSLMVHLTFVSATFADHHLFVLLFFLQNCTVL
jgi:hypothetical protein